MRGRWVATVVALASLALAAPLAATGADTTAAAVRATTLKVTAGKPAEFDFTLSKKAAAKGVVTFKVTNRGKLVHDFKIGGKRTKLLAPGKTATLKVKLKKGKFKFLCTVPGHAAAGMRGTLRVK